MSTAAARLLTPAQAAEVVGVPAAKISKWIERGKLVVEWFTVGDGTRRSRIPESEVNRVKKLVEGNLPLPVVVTGE